MVTIRGVYDALTASFFLTTGTMILTGGDVVEMGLQCVALLACLFCILRLQGVPSNLLNSRKSSCCDSGEEEEMDQEEFESSICFRGVRNPCSVCGCKRSGGVRGETKSDVLDQHDNDQIWRECLWNMLREIDSDTTLKVRGKAGGNGTSSSFNPNKQIWNGDQAGEHKSAGSNTKTCKGALFRKFSLWKVREISIAAFVQWRRLREAYWRREAARVDWFLSWRKQLWRALMATESQRHAFNIHEMEGNRNGDHGKKANGKGRAVKGHAGSIDLCEIVGRLIHQKALCQKSGRKVKGGL
ncbi:hypothetical protein GUITHDRAFT_99084 [Guillardia theta CCMP2712]|uniref:Uncharacterized protein n=1 Tax=Guillardia theta (strain CCMP2712) TaxID=905079 RepID=L1K4D5_GUITC|nr:hypothetical protein GUITHDRAFT_99084 [Guillardia theta CCMP2712]EKX55305.1 hypothetical protein GUITHDRAFT_99084 [Guillardia theta CCMP2712]|eukprot:XP_005842285.1 hypothetical protein GUITHDRAFT_99084 [Guillardia theta CCMP2712]